MSAYEIPVSRQRRYQIRHEQAGLCALCSRPAVTKYHCEVHRRANNLREREKQRVRFGFERRYLNAKSYHFGRPAEAAAR